MTKNLIFRTPGKERPDTFIQESAHGAFQSAQNPQESHHSIPNDEKLLDRDDMVKMFNVSYVTLRSWEKKGSIPKPIRVGKRVYWQKAKIISFISNGKVNLNF